MGAKKPENTKSLCLCGIMISLEKKHSEYFRGEVSRYPRLIFKWFGGGGILCTQGSILAIRMKEKYETFHSIAFLFLPFYGFDIFK